jgi:hypothetical protein
MPLRASTTHRPVLDIASHTTTFRIVFEQLKAPGLPTMVAGAGGF